MSSGCRFPICLTTSAGSSSKAAKSSCWVSIKCLSSTTPVAFVPVAFQFVGRWGLYLFVTKKFNIVPGSPYYDAFEDRKQPLELAAVLGGVAVAYLSNN